MQKKSKMGITQALTSCHTGLVGGYFIEGHVPAKDIENLLIQKPDIAGISVPNMPVGSPGMEVPGMIADKYDVLAVGKDGSISVFSSH